MVEVNFSFAGQSVSCSSVHYLGQFTPWPVTEKGAQPPVVPDKRCWTNLGQLHKQETRSWSRKNSSRAPRCKANSHHKLIKIEGHKKICCQCDNAGRRTPANHKVETSYECSFCTVPLWRVCNRFQDYHSENIVPVAQNSGDDNGGGDGGDTDNGSDMWHCTTHRHCKLSLNKLGSLLSVNSGEYFISKERKVTNKNHCGTLTYITDLDNTVLVWHSFLWHFMTPWCHGHCMTGWDTHQ